VQEPGVYLWGAKLAKTLPAGGDVVVHMAVKGSYSLSAIAEEAPGVEVPFVIDGTAQSGYEAPSPVSTSYKTTMTEDDLVVLAAGGGTTANVSPTSMSTDQIVSKTSTVFASRDVSSGAHSSAVSWSPTTSPRSWLEAALVMQGTTTYSPVKVGTKYLPEAMQGVPYSFTLTATAGTAPYTWSIPSGPGLPAGLRLNATTGAITGTPTSPGTTSLTVEVTDSRAPTPMSATARLSLTVQPHPPVITSLTPTFGSASGHRYIEIYGKYLWQGSSSCLWYTGSGCPGMTVYVGSNKAFVIYSSPGVALVLSPPGSAGTVNVQVDLNGLKSAITPADLYTYTS
jgi:hypothetical protein